MRRAVGGGFLLALAILFAGCGNNVPAEQSSPKGGDASAMTPDMPAIVGEWKRTNRCEELATALADAGVDPAIAAENIWGGFFWPQVQTFEEFEYDEDDPCRGAKPLQHSHFFTADGAFGSKDQNGEQVDDGTYEVTEDGTLVINGDVQFEYRVEGDSLSMEPIVPTDCDSDDCQHKLAYSIAVAYPGHTWELVS